MKTNHAEQHTKGSPCKHLQILLKQLLTELAKRKECTRVEQLILPIISPPTFEVFYIHNLEVILPDTLLPTTDNKIGLDKVSMYRNYIHGINDHKTMLIFTDGSAMSNPGPTGAGVVIRKNGPTSIQIKEATALSKRGTSFEAELEAINIGTKYAKDNLPTDTAKVHIFSDCYCSIQAIMKQNNEYYHNSTISSIRDNLLELSSKVNSVKIIYIPAHKGFTDNETADELAKIAAKGAKTLASTCNVTTSEIKMENINLTLTKWQRRWDNSANNMYKNIVPTITKDILNQHKTQLKHTSRRMASKIIRLKSGHSMLKGHKSKIDKDTNPLCDHCKVVETPSHFLLHCKQFEEDRRKMILKITDVFNRNSTYFNHTTGELLGEHTLKKDDSKLIRHIITEFINVSKKEV